MIDMTVKRAVHPHPTWSEKYTDEMGKKALELFADGDSICSICCDIGISRETYYRWRDDKTHPFSEIAKEGEQLTQAFWEKQGKKAIFGGVDKFAGSTYQFVMRNRFRNEYSDSTTQNGQLSAVEKLVDALLASGK